MTNIYREPDPPMGPDRVSDAYPLGPDAAEVRELRPWTTFHPHIGGSGGVRRAPLPDLGPEQYRSHEEYMAARDLEQWGYNPFTEYEE